MAQLKQSAAYNRMILMVAASDHVAGLAGLTLTITASKNGGAFASIAPVVTDRGAGWYSLALTAAMTAGIGLSSTGAASAAHCVKDGSPGFSYFGQDGREDGNPRGASACREATGSPSNRAPGQTK